MKQFMLGLVVALVCGTTAAAEGFWVCKVDYPNEDMIVNLHADRMVLIKEEAVLNTICSNNVCIDKADYGEDDSTLRIVHVDYQNDKPFSLLFTKVFVQNKKLGSIATDSKAHLLFQCTKF